MSEELPSVHDTLMKRTTPASAQRPPMDEADQPSAPRSIKKIALWTIGGLVLIGLGIAASQLSVLRDIVSTADAGNTRQNVAAQKSDPAADDPFSKLATNAGAKTCSAVYSALGNALTNGTDYMVNTQAATTDADKHSLAGAVGMTFKTEVEGGFKGTAAGLVFAAPVATGCEGAMIRIVPFSQSCDAAAALLPQGSQPLQPLRGLPFYNLSTGGQALMMPSAQGCVVISIARAAA